MAIAIDSQEEEVLATIPVEIARCAIKFENLLSQIESGTKAGECFSQIKHDVTNLHLLCRDISEVHIDLLMHRFHLYLMFLEKPSPENLRDIKVFTDIMQAIMNGEVNQETDQAEFVRSLPVLRPADLSDTEHLKIEILLVEPKKSAAFIVARELTNCGFGVAIATNMGESIDLAIRTRPNMVMTAMTLDGGSGTELIKMLRILEATRSTPMAVLTSFEQDDPQLGNLPEQTIILRKGAKFAEDLQNIMQPLGLI